MTCANHDHIFTTSVFRKIIGDNISIIHLRIIVDYFIAIMIYDNTSVAKIFLKRNVQEFRIRIEDCINIIHILRR